MKGHRSLDPSIDQVKGAAIATGSRRLNSLAASRRKASHAADAPDRVIDRSADSAAKGSEKDKADVDARGVDAMPGVSEEPSSTSPRLRRSRRNRSTSRIFISILKRRTWVLPLLLTLPVLAAYFADPRPSNPAHAFVVPSYAIETTAGLEQQQQQEQQYGKGLRDVAFVAFYTIVISFFREFVMHEILHPVAISVLRLQRSRLARFKEQMYTAVYTLFSSALGIWVLRTRQLSLVAPATTATGVPTLSASVVGGLQSWWHNYITMTFSTNGLYEGYPHTTHDALTKTYYLLQAAFWAQQALVMLLGLERRRKDFKELVMHHVVTLALVALSYRFHFTVVGCLVFVSHDLSDFFLAISKSINYTDHPAQAPSFAWCIAAWIYLRHYVNLNILYSVLTGFRTVGPYVLDWEAEQFKCAISAVITFSLLASLQALNLFWLYCLGRSAWKFVVLGIAKDDREDGEEEEEEEVLEIGDIGTDKPFTMVATLEKDGMVS